MNDHGSVVQRCLWLTDTQSGLLLKPSYELPLTFAYICNLLPPLLAYHYSAEFMLI